MSPSVRETPHRNNLSALQVFFNLTQCKLSDDLPQCCSKVVRREQSHLTDMKCDHEKRTVFSFLSENVIYKTSVKCTCDFNFTDHYRGNENQVFNLL